MSGSGFAQFIPLILIFVIFYFFLIRPQQKRVKEHKLMVAALKRGDEVVTSGGIVGRVKKILDKISLGQKEFWAKKILGKKILANKSFEQKKLCPKCPTKKRGRLK